VERSIVPVPATEGRNSALDGNDTLLLVEDEADVLAVMAEMLRSAGYTVLTAEDGAAALELYERRSSEIDLVVTDVMMPRLSGPELARKVASIRQEARVLLVSGYSHEELSRQEMTEEVELLLKPFGRTDLLKKIRRILDGTKGSPAAQSSEGEGSAGAGRKSPLQKPPRPALESK
jgi:DNA-binding NtrC family response regulator